MLSDRVRISREGVSDGTSIAQIQEWEVCDEAGLSHQAHSAVAIKVQVGGGAMIK